MIYIKYEGRFGNNLFQYCRALCKFKDSGHGIINPLKSKMIKIPNPQNKNSETVFQDGFFQDKETVDLFKKTKANFLKTLMKYRVFLFMLGLVTLKIYGILK